MDRKPYTLRLDVDLFSALSLLSGVKGRSINDLITEAVSSYVSDASERVAHRLEATLNKLRAISVKDNDFEDAIERVAEGEARHKDPLEGEIVSLDAPLEDQLKTLLADG